MTESIDETDHNRRLPGAELPPGAMRLVEDDGRKIGVFNCDGELYAIEDRCSHDDGPLAEGEFDAGACTVECPRHGSLFDLSTGRPKTLPAYLAGRDVPGPRRGRHHQLEVDLTWQRPRVAVAEKTTSWPASTPTTRRSSASTIPRPATPTRRRRASPRDRRTISEYKDEPQWMRDFRLKALEHFEQPPDPEMGRQPRPDRLRRHPLLRPRLGEEQPHWGEVPEDIKNTFDRLGIPEAERKFLSGVGAQYESEVVYHQVRTRSSRSRA